MRGADRYEDAGLPDFQPPKPMNDRHPVDRETIVNVFRYFPHLGEGHGFVRLIFQIKRGSSVRVVAHTTVEGGESAVFISTNLAGNGCAGNDFACQFDAVLRFRCGHLSLTATDRRKEAHFIPAGKRSIPRGKFAVARRH